MLNQRTLATLTVFAVTLTASTGRAFAQGDEHGHADILIAVDAADPAKLLTGHSFVDDGQFELGARIFEVDLEPTTDFPNVANNLYLGDQGFFTPTADSGDLPAGTLPLPAGDMLLAINSFSIGSQSANAWFWDALSPDVAFSPLAGGTRIILDNNPFFLTADGSDSDVTTGGPMNLPFRLQTIGSNGALHSHIDIRIDDLTLDALPEAGIYLLALQASINPISQEIFVLLNTAGELGEQRLGDAEAFIESNLIDGGSVVPAPAALPAGLALMGLIIARRRNAATAHTRLYP